MPIRINLDVLMAKNVLALMFCLRESGDPGELVNSEE